MDNLVVSDAMDSDDASVIESRVRLGGPNVSFVPNLEEETNQGHVVPSRFSLADIFASKHSIKYH